MSGDLGTCGVNHPCDTMHERLRAGSVLRDVLGALRYANGAPLPYCPWCESVLMLTAFVVEDWDWGQTYQADGSP